MGFFSKCCAKTNLPVLYADPTVRRLAPHLTTIMVLLRNGAVYEAEYDGYGLNLVDSGDWDDAKLVLKSAYAGEKYADLPASHDEPQQGYFFSNEQIEALAAIPAFKTFDDYEEFLKSCDRIDEEVTVNLLAELNAPAAVPWYTVVDCFNAVRECQEMPENSIIAGRYARAREKHGALVDFMPQNPLEAVPLVTRFFETQLERLRKNYAQLVATVLATPTATQS